MSTQGKSVADRLMAAVGGWLFNHMELMFRIARNTVPILIMTYRGKRFALVTRFDDVAEVLSRPNVFDVIYAPKIRVIMDGDNIFLGMRDVEQATRDKTTMRMTAPRAEALTRVKPEVTALAESVMATAAAAGRVDLAMELTQDVTTRFFGRLFRHPWARRENAFRPGAVAVPVHVRRYGRRSSTWARARPVAAALRAYIEGVIVERKHGRGTHDDILERCLQFQDLGLPGMDDRGIRNNLIGLIVGAMPQAPMLIPQLFDVLLDRPKELAEAQAAARADDDAAVARYVFEASRYFPLTPGLFRDATEDYRLAGGTWRARTIPAGTRVMAATRSAMFDGRRIPDPTSFRLDRPDYAYMHFGAGMHECFGLYMNREMVPAICKAVLKRPGLRRAAGDAGRLKMESIFPISLVVEFDA